MTQRVKVICENYDLAVRDIPAALDWFKTMLKDGNPMQAEFRKLTRSLAQNQIMWSCLADLSKQVKWFGKHLTKEGWKDYITGHLNGQELHPNMDGTGFISINRGSSTSDMTIAEMSAVIELSHAFGADQGVVWSKTSLGRHEQPARQTETVDADTGEILEETA